MAQFRVVYSYKAKDGRVNGAGACFVFARSEQDAREVFARTWPDGTITKLSEEPEDPLRIFERPGVTA